MRRNERERLVSCMALVWAIWIDADACAQGPDVRGESRSATGIVDALIHGEPTLDVRGRIELAKGGTTVNGELDRSEAYTIRTRLGYGTRPWYGVRVYTNFENVAAAVHDSYFDPTRLPNSRGQTPIAEPTGTEINEGFLELDRPDWLGSQLVGGRQRIVYDDARFIGDVGWRQNQQTFDAVNVSSSLGFDDFELGYAWIGHVNRVFGGGGNNPNLRDFDSSSHLVHLGYEPLDQLQLTAFAYLLDLEISQATLFEPAANSGQTYGFRLKGAFDAAGVLTLDYLASYAYQTDYADKVQSYRAHYVDTEVSLDWQDVARLSIGWEMLGSDDGAQQFLTPLATAHKFSGWADVYLNNGGPAGLRDLRLAVAPVLPWKLAGEIVYHRFWDDDLGRVRGNEIDAVVKRPFGEHLLLLAKGAYFDSATDDFAELDTWRFWFDVVVKF